MECNKEEAFRAKELAERKMETKDFLGAKKIAQKAQKLYPELENICQLVAVCEVHCAAEEKVNGLLNWYGILQVDVTAEESVIKKQYRRLAFLLHPDKNRFPGAEAAFKLIGEAHMTLSDQLKRSAYDLKSNGHLRPSSTKYNSQQRQKKTAATSVSNKNKEQPHVSASAFWTMCHFCRTKYKYSNVVLNKIISCQSCARPFIAKVLYEKEVPPSTLFNTGDLPKTEHHGHSQMQAQTYCAGGNVGVQTRTTHKDKGSDITMESSTSKVGAEVGNLNANQEKFDSEELSRRGEGPKVFASSESGKLNDKQNHCETGNLRRSPRIKLDVACKRTGTKANNGNVSESPSKRPRKDAQHPVHSTDKDIPDGGENDTSAAKGSSIDGADGSNMEKPTENKQEIGEEKHARAESSTEKNNDNPGSYSYPDTEFHDFETCRDVSKFLVDQIWALYDTLDGMPRYYARIRSVRSSPSFNIRFTWLEYDPDPENQAELNWSGKELPVACGKYVIGHSELTDDPLIFSHIVSWRKGKKKRSYEIYPMKGEVWALYRNWSIQWSAEAKTERKYAYELVEVLSDFTTKAGITVFPLMKVAGFVSLFVRASDETPLVIPPGDIFRFSHNIPFYRTNGNEKPGIPEGFLELDTASLPGNIDVHFPSTTLESCLAQARCFNGVCNASSLNVEQNEKKLHSANDTSKENQQQPSNGPNGCTTAEFHSDVLNDRKRVNDSANQSDSCHASSHPTYVYPDAEFHDFEQQRSAGKFQAGQIWALYSDLDRFPKYYAWVIKVDEEPFGVHLRWLEACPHTEEEKRLLDQNVQVSCGHFMVANGRIKLDSIDFFSHLVKARPCNKKYLIIPSTGELWAIYRNWNPGWSPSNFLDCDYDIVEVLECLEVEAKVYPLMQVEGYRCVFKREPRQKLMNIPRAEYLRFSHKIPSHQLTEERGGKLRGCWELDPASVPDAFLFRDSN